ESLAVLHTPEDVMVPGQNDGGCLAPLRVGRLSGWKIVPQLPENLVRTRREGGIVEVDFPRCGIRVVGCHGPETLAKRSRALRDCVTATRRTPGPGREIATAESSASAPSCGAATRC